MVLLTIGGAKAPLASLVDSPLLDAIVGLAVLVFCLVSSCVALYGP
jgi:hypothetical protein